jgi:hypothetical protein
MRILSLPRFSTVAFLECRQYLQNTGEILCVIFLAITTLIERSFSRSVEWGKLMPVRDDTSTFLSFCELITGYSVLDLTGTGLAGSYKSILDAALGPAMAQRFYLMASQILAVQDVTQREIDMRENVLASPIFWPVVSNLMSLWYLGAWNVLPDAWYIASGQTKPGVGESGSSCVPSAAAYIEQLSYLTAGAHTPGAKPTGYGSWSVPPVF